MQTKDELNEIRPIQSIVTRVAHHIDRKNWNDLRTLYDDVVETDYRSLFGGEIQQQKAVDLIATWQRILTPLNATQHVLGPIDVQIQGDAATAECHVRAYHYLKDAPGGEYWTVAGHYVFELKRRLTDWTIYKMKLETFYQTGNTKLLQEGPEH